jgi:hypothetical protein
MYQNFSTFRSFHNNLIKTWSLLQKYAHQVTHTLLFFFFFFSFSGSESDCISIGTLLTITFSMYVCMYLCIGLLTFGTCVMRSVFWRKKGSYLCLNTYLFITTEVQEYTFCVTWGDTRGKAKALHPFHRNYFLPQWNGSQSIAQEIILRQEYV